jgi:hypothetical protein
LEYWDYRHELPSLALSLGFLNWRNIFKICRAFIKSCTSLCIVFAAVLAIINALCFIINLPVFTKNAVLLSDVLRGQMAEELLLETLFFWRHGGLNSGPQAC